MKRTVLAVAAALLLAPNVPHLFDIITNTDGDTYWHRSPAA